MAQSGAADAFHVPPHGATEQAARDRDYPKAGEWRLGVATSFGRSLCLNYLQQTSVYSAIYTAQVPGMRVSDVKGLLKVCQRLRSDKDATAQSLAASLSTRQLIRVARRMAASGDGADHKKLISDAIHRACLSRQGTSLTVCDRCPVLSDRVGLLFLMNYCPVETSAGVSNRTYTSRAGSGVTTVAQTFGRAK